MDTNKNSIKVIAIFLLLSLPFLSNCFTTLQTAKTTDGVTFTTGIQRYYTERHRSYYPYGKYYEAHHILLLMPRIGKAAPEKKIGWDFGLRVLTDIVDHGEYKPIWFIVEEGKIQIPKNKFLDLAFSIEFWSFVPAGVSMLFSKDLSKKFTLYGELELLGGLYNLTHRDAGTGLTPKAALGTEVNLAKHVSFLFELERFLNAFSDSHLDTRLNLGVSLKFPIKRKKSGLSNKNKTQ